VAGGVAALGDDVDGFDVVDRKRGVAEADVGGVGLVIQHQGEAVVGARGCALDAQTVGVVAGKAINDGDGGAVGNAGDVDIALATQNEVGVTRRLSQARDWGCRRATINVQRQRASAGLFKRLGTDGGVIDLQRQRLVARHRELRNAGGRGVAGAAGAAGAIVIGGADGQGVGGGAGGVDGELLEAALVSGSGAFDVDLHRGLGARAVQVDLERFGVARAGAGQGIECDGQGLVVAAGERHFRGGGGDVGEHAVARAGDFHRLDTQHVGQIKPSAVGQQVQLEGLDILHRGGSKRRGGRCWPPARRCRWCWGRAGRLYH